jgi:septum formation topological specificity factor MinE
MKENNSRFKRASMLIFILTGLILISSSIIWEYKAGTASFTQKILMNLLAHLGIGALVLGILSILIDTKHWTEYFKQRLADVVMDKKHLENLTPTALIDLQTEILKVYFKDTSIGGEGGFLKFYQKDIQEIIGDPFRINLEDDYLIKYDKSKEKINVHEEILYYCKGNCGKIQKEIRWLSGEDEFDEITYQCIKLEHDSFFEATHNPKEKIFDFKNFKPEWIKDNGRGFIFPLSEYETLDGLKITIIVDYTIAWHKFIAWRMTLLTKGLTLTIRFPDDLTITREIFGRGSTFEVRNDETGYFKLVTQGWILPNEGVVFQFYKKTKSPSLSVGTPPTD